MYFALFIITLITVMQFLHFTGTLIRNMMDCLSYQAYFVVKLTTASALKKWMVWRSKTNLLVIIIIPTLISALADIDVPPTIETSFVHFVQL